MSDCGVTFRRQRASYVSWRTPLVLLVSGWAVLLTCRVTDRTVLDRSSSEEMRFGSGRAVISERELGHTMVYFIGKLSSFNRKL